MRPSARALSPPPEHVQLSRSVNHHVSFSPFLLSQALRQGSSFVWILRELGTRGSDALAGKDPSPRAEIFCSTCQEPWENPHYRMRKEERNPAPVGSILWAKFSLSFSFCLSLFLSVFFCFFPGSYKEVTASVWCNRAEMISSSCMFVDCVSTGHIACLSLSVSLPFCQPACPCFCLFLSLSFTERYFAGLLQQQMIRVSSKKKQMETMK